MRIESIQTRQTLERLHRAADGDLPRIAQGFARSLGRGLKPEHMRDAFIAIERGQGQWLFDRVVERRAQTIVEFGTSFGISAIWLGAAAQRFGGRVITTEIEPQKVGKARDNIASAGLAEVVTVLEGDVLETLAGWNDPIDFLFFDGWSDLYEPLLELLEPYLVKGCPLVVDNANFRGTRRFVKRLAQRSGWHLGAGPDRRTAYATFCAAAASAPP